MTWFLVPVRCAGPSDTDVSEAFYELDDDDIAVLSVTAGDVDAASGRQTVELDLAIDDHNAGAAAARVQALFAADPDFELVSLGDITETTHPRALSDEALSILRASADELRDDLRDDIRLLRDGGSFEDTVAVSEHLPAVFARHYTPELFAQWAGSVETVAHKLAAYPDTCLATTAEELAGHALIAYCETLIDEREGELDDPDGVREKFSEAHDLAFEDHDVLLLFDARFDGIEDSDIGEMMGMANLSVRDWFKPFRADR
jgi:hypothetical protein